MAPNRKHKPEIITEAGALAHACEQFAEAGWLAFDTEFVGEQHYNQEVCLIQAATDSLCVLIDPIGGLDVTPFWELVADEKIEVIVHAGTEDLAICWKQGGHQPSNVFDLQVAAGFVGLGYPISLSRMGHLTTGVKIHKGQTLSDWQQRPLTKEQIEYAVEDVIHLPGITRHLQEKLTKLGRTAWMREEMAVMCDPATLAIDTEQRLKRLRGTGSLNRRALATVEGLLEERERLALEYDRPPRTVLRDHLLVEIARRGWTDMKRIRSLRGVSLSNDALRRIIGAVKTAQALPETELPPAQAPNDEDTPQEDVLLALMGAVLRDLSTSKKIAYSLLTNKQDLRALVRSHTRPNEGVQPCPLRQGWRRDAVGEVLDHILLGQSAVRVSTTGKGATLTIE